MKYLKLKYVEMKTICDGEISDRMISVTYFYHKLPFYNLVTHFYQHVCNRIETEISHIIYVQNYTTKDTGHAGGRISLHSFITNTITYGSNRRHDSTAFITNAGELSVGKLRSCVSETAGTF